jgi:hypothetical protein
LKSGVVWSKSGKGIVGSGEEGKRAKTTPDAGGKQHLTIHLTTFRRHETTMDVTMLKKRTTTRTRGGSRHVEAKKGIQDEVVIHTCHGWHVAAGMQDEVVIHTCYG